MRIIFWAGDSTNTENKAHNYPQTGIAQAFDRYTASDVVIYNHAVNGRSTKSFIDQGRLETIYNEITEDDFLFIQFGHNDEKSADPLRYTDPDDDFIVNLGRFAKSAKNKRAYPVFITPVERRLFNEDGFTLKSPSAHKPYVDAYFEAGRRYDVPVIDLWSLSRAFLERRGDKASVRYFMHLKPGEAFWCPKGQEDNTHLKYEGAMAFGKLIAEELYRMDDIYSSLIDPKVLSALNDHSGTSVINEDLIDEKNIINNVYRE
ncbi:MAG: rhamnogalacturonan acetylesterase [Lachnospiraceae bacterium]|nr:rhamnogalacturonan acetylesterase [Lachnospiraceae bacterium]